MNNVASEMVGSRKDVTALKVAYETIGFNVRIYEDCSAQVNYWYLFQCHYHLVFYLSIFHIISKSKRM